MTRGPQLIRWLHRGQTAKMRMAVFLCAASVFAACASSLQKTPDTSGEWLTEADQMPTYDIVPPQPRLPRNLTGGTEIMTKTTIEFYVDEKGLVNPVLTNIKESSGYYDLDRITLQWANRITFHPGRNQGEPVKVIVCKEVQWMVR